MAQKERFDRWTYDSENSITTPGDLRGTYWPGLKVALKQGSIKYFVIESVTFDGSITRITLNGMGTYSLTNDPIIAHIDSTEDCPKGFPQEKVIFGDIIHKGHRITWGTEAPSDGTWTRGDICWNSEPAAGSPPGWICIDGGSPGVWKAMAPLST